MNNNQDNYIEANIIRPLELSLQGIDPKVKVEFTMLGLDGKVWYVRDKLGLGEQLSQAMRPYVEEFLFEPHRRMHVHIINDISSESYWVCKGIGFIRWYLQKYEGISTYFMGRDLQDVVETWCNNYSSGDSIHTNIYYLLAAARDGYSTDWHKLQQYVVPELKNCPSDYDKIRLEYYCALDAIIKVSLDPDSDIEQKRMYWTQINTYWHILTSIYSVMTGKILNSGYNHISAIVGRFKGSDKPFARLMCAALRHHPQVLPAQKVEQFTRELQNITKEIKQEKMLDSLCRILFPTAGWCEYDIVTPRMTTAEMIEKINETENMKLLLAQTEQLAQALKTELDNSIKMQELHDAFNKIDAKMASTIFSQLDMVLENHNEVWDNHRKQLKHELNLRTEHERQLAENTYNNALAANEYARQAALRPVQQINHYEKDSVSFQAGSTMNGNVIVNE